MITKSTFSTAYGFFTALALIFSFVGTVEAQYLETGIFLGTANYKGDIAQKMNPSEYNGAYGMTMRYNFTPKFSAKASILAAYISGSDAKAPASLTQRERNLSFRSDMVELGIQGEFSPLGYDVLDGKVSTPYIFAGIAGTYFNPQAELTGIWYDLQPLATEGKEYSRFTVAIPMGVGFRFALGRRVNLGLEIGARKTFTDYLDDVSGAYPDVTKLDPTAARFAYRPTTADPMPNPMGTMRGNPANKDWYFVGGINLSFNLTDQYGMEWNKKYRIHD